MSEHLHSKGCGCGHSHEEHTHETHNECGCGHHHESHDECGCGHDHENHDECDCGHDHETHDECGCGHHHEHETHTAPVSHGQGVQRKVYHLEHLGCANCASKMESRIRTLDGIEEATITFATQQLRVWAADPDAHLEEIQRICADIEPEVIVSPLTVRGKKAVEEPEEEENPLPAIIGGAVLFALGVILGKVLPAVEPIGTSPFALGVLVIGYLLLGGEVLKTAFGNIIRGKVFDENFLMSVATLGAFFIGDYPEAVGVMLFYRIGEFFEDAAVSRSRSNIMGAMDLRPEVVQLLQPDGTTLTLPAEEAQVGDLLQVRPGDRIPLDGTVTEGESLLDTSPMTGEPVPVAIRPGSAVLSGCMNQTGVITLQVDRPLEGSMVSRILESVENAAASKPRIDRFITRFSRIYTPVVVSLALAAAVIPSLLWGNPMYWIKTACTFLVISCPCALVLSVPLAFFAGIGAGSRQNILFKGGAAMEALSTIQTVVMDKTGTITKGNFVLQNVLPAQGHTQDEVLALAAGCERSSTHPIAQSICAAAEERNITPATFRSVREESGKGIAADDVLCGNRSLLEANGIYLPPQTETMGTQVYLAKAGAYLGQLVISDTLKEGAAEAIGKLNRMGLHTAMLTGDSKDSADAVAREVGMKQVCAKLLPQEKLSALQEIRKEHGSALFVGDGINDAVVLAGADVGGAMGSGADAAIEAADLVFLTGNVDAIGKSIAISRKSVAIARQNVIFALVVKLLVIIVGLAGHANMWAAVFADTGVAMLCILNSIRTLYGK